MQKYISTAKLQSMKKKHKNDLTQYPNEARLTQRYSENREETLKEMLVKRNNYIIRAFSDCPYDVFLYGSAEAPMIVINNYIKLSAYVSNFYLYFNESPLNKAKTVLKFKINFTHKVSADFLDRYIIENSHEDWTVIKSKPSISKYLNP